MTSLLVTNDFPPKHGGIQSYLYELWRRLPADDTVVFTTRFPGDLDWDAEQSFRVVRSRHAVFLPTRTLAADIDALARDVAGRRRVRRPVAAARRAGADGSGPRRTSSSCTAPR